MAGEHLGKTILSEQVSDSVDKSHDYNNWLVWSRCNIEENPKQCYGDHRAA